MQEVGGVMLLCRVAIHWEGTNCGKCWMVLVRPSGRTGTQPHCSGGVEGSER